MKNDSLFHDFLMGYACAMGVWYALKWRITEDGQKWRTILSGKHDQMDTVTRVVVIGKIGTSNVGGQKASKSVSAHIKRGNVALRKDERQQWNYTFSSPASEKIL